VRTTCFFRKIRNNIFLAVLCLTQWNTTIAQSANDSSLSILTGYNNATLGFRYMPPSEMQDKTERARAEIQAPEESPHTSSTLHLLLAMSSGAGDTASDWHSLSIEISPRRTVADLDDISAEAKMGEWVAGSKARAAPRSVVASGQNFAVSIYGRDEGPTKKFIVVWTTIRKDKLLSFAFAANSPEQLKKLTESMKSVQFF
jgi:hypothetical protein